MISPAMEVDERAKRYDLLLAIARKMAGTLSRYGMPVLPDELGDAVHEFWITTDAAPGESEASDAYCRRALYSFTARMWRRKRRFVQLFELEAGPLDGLTEEDRLLNDHLKYRIREIMDRQLAEPRTRLILRFFEEGPRCERLLSREFSMTRYRVREEILNGVGVVLVHLADLSAWSEPDRRVAAEIWGRSLSLTEAAMTLSLPLATVREAHRRNLTQLKKLIL
jgi:hypothetical protein